jgi:hypothetical protein
MLAQLWQRCHRNEGNICHCDDGEDAWASMATMPLQQGQQHHRDDGKDACAMMMTMTQLQWGWQCQLGDGNKAITTRATMLLQIKSNNAIVTRATMPSQWRQGCLRINNSNNAIIMSATIPIATMAKPPAHWLQQCHHDKGDDANSMMSNEGNNASLTTVETPAHWQWWGDHCYKSNNCHCNIGKDACASMAMTPAWQWGARATTLMITTTPLQQGWQYQLEDSNDAIMTSATMLCRSRATMPFLWGQQCRPNNGKDASALTAATTPLWWGQQFQSRQRQKCLCINGNNTIPLRATMPAWQQATRATMLAQQWPRRCALATVITPSWREQQSPLQQWQRCLHIDNNASLMISNKGDDIDDDNNAIVTRATMPAWRQQQCHCNEGNAVADQGQ